MPVRLLFATTFCFFLMFKSAFAWETVVPDEAGVDLSAGYRSDHLEWNIAGDSDGLNPNILSELTWEDVETFELQARGWLEFNELPYFKRDSLLLTHLSFGKIMDGDVQDSDYATDNRTNEWSRSVNKADVGFMVDISGGWGPVFKFERFKKITLVPLLGYAFNMQALSMTSGEQRISDDGIRTTFFGSDAELPPDLGTINGLDSTYTAYWYGPWLGLQLDYQASDKLKFKTGLEYHLVEFYAQADWNLRSEFAHPVSFEHEADGSGVVWTFTGLYQLNEKWSVLCDLNIQSWQAEDGTDRTFFADGRVSRSQLNKVKWESYALTTGVQYRF